MVQPLDYPLNHKYVKHQNKTAELALQTPIINYRDGFGCVGHRGKHIDSDSFLKYNSLLTHHGAKTTLPHSGFSTVPFMGSGCRSLSQHPRLEAEYTYAPKSTLAAGARSRFVPLVGCLADEIQNTEHIIPEDNHVGWYRGGYPSRGCKYHKESLPKPIKPDMWPFVN